MTDVVAFGDAALQLSPRDGERLASAREAQVAVCGVESGAAAAVTAVGGEGTWVSKLPDSPLGRQTVGQLRQHGVRTEVAWADPDETRHGLVFREFGHAPREGAVRHDREGTAVASADPGDFPMDRVQSADAVFAGASTAALSGQAATTTEAMFRAARASGVTTATAVDYREGLRPPGRYRETLLGLVEHVDVFVGREDHVETVFNTSGRPRELAHALTAEFDLETVVVTRSDCSAVALHDSPGTNVVHEQSADETDAVDTTGRQAAFVGGLLGRLAAGATLPEALVGAVATATLACTTAGPLPAVTPEEVESLVGQMTTAG